MRIDNDSGSLQSDFYNVYLILIHLASGVKVFYIIMPGGIPPIPPIPP